MEMTSTTRSRRSSRMHAFASHAFQSISYVLTRKKAFALALCSVAFSTFALAAGPCDLNNDGSVTASDVTLAINMALGTSPCTAGLEGNSICTVITVQRVTNASLGGPCVTYNTHSATLSWTASTTPGVSSYNVYRATSSSGPFTTPIASVTSGTTYQDTTVVAGQTYYYEVTAVLNGVESSPAGPAQGTIPTP